MIGPLGPGIRIMGDTPDPAIAVTMSCISESSMLPRKSACQYSPFGILGWLQ